MPALVRGPEANQRLLSLLSTGATQLMGAKVKDSVPRSVVSDSVSESFPMSQLFA